MKFILWAIFIVFAIHGVLLVVGTPKSDPIPENCMKTEEKSGILERDGVDGYLNGNTVIGFKLTVQKQDQAGEFMSEHTYVLATTNGKVDEELRQLTKHGRKPTIKVIGVIGHRLRSAEIIIIKSYQDITPKTP